MSAKTVFLAAFLTAASASVSHAAGVEVGKLDCDVSSSVGAILGSKQTTSCVFKPSGNGEAVRYSGTITRFGLDIGDVAKSRLVWLVYAPTRGDQGDLQGTYRGVDANASLGLGAGANVLLGDGKHSFSLQPVSIEGEEGVNLAVGVSEFKLEEL